MAVKGRRVDIKNAMGTTLYVKLEYMTSGQLWPDDNGLIKKKIDTVTIIFYK